MRSKRPEREAGAWLQAECVPVIWQVDLNSEPVPSEGRTSAKALPGNPDSVQVKMKDRAHNPHRSNSQAANSSSVWSLAGASQTSAVAPRGSLGS